MGWVKKLWHKEKSALAGLAHIAAPLAGPWAPAVDRAANMFAPGDSAQRNQRKRSDFEYARSLADQRAFADDSVQRRVADARKAGINPTAALGFSSPGFIPPQGGGTDYSTSGDNLYGMGQDISRAVAASQTDQERAQSATVQSNLDNLQLRNLDLQNKGLELQNAFRLSQLVRMREGVGPGFPRTNTNRQVGLAELGSTGTEPGSTTYTGVGNSSQTTNSVNLATSLQGDPWGVAKNEWARYFEPYWNPKLERFISNLSGASDYELAKILNNNNMWTSELNLPDGSRTAFKKAVRSYMRNAGAASQYMRYQ